MPPVIHSLIPYKENYTPENAGAVALTVKDGFTQSRYAERAVVFGRAQQTKPSPEPLPKPLWGVNYLGLKPRQALLFGRNIGLARAYLDHIRQNGAPDLLEVHGRCQVAQYIAARRKELNIALYLHNDPQTMAGARTRAMRRQLLDRMAAIFCVSNYLKQRFLDGLEHNSRDREKITVIPAGVDRTITKPVKKEKLIILVGRMVPEKGILEAAQALASVLPQYPEWQARFIGARKFEESNKTAYEKQVEKTLEPVSGQALMTGFLPPDSREKQDLQHQAAIALVPSQWQEPAGRVVLEALAAGAALITTRRGGIPEYAEGRAIMLDNADPASLATALDRLIGDDRYRLHWQQKAWDDYPFSVAHAVARLDAAREAIIGKADHG